MNIQWKFISQIENVHYTKAIFYYIKFIRIIPFSCLMLEKETKKKVFQENKIP